MIDKRKNAKAIEKATKLLKEVENLYEQLYDMETVIKARTREIDCIIDKDGFEYSELDDNTEQEKEYYETVSAIGRYISDIEDRFRW